MQKKMNGISPLHWCIQRGKLIGNSKGIEGKPSIREERNGGASGPQLSRPLQHHRLYAHPLQSHSSRQATDASSDYHHFLIPHHCQRHMCVCAVVVPDEQGKIDCMCFRGVWGISFAWHISRGSDGCSYLYRGVSGESSALQTVLTNPWDTRKRESMAAARFLTIQPK